jgi:hypothetical protein
MKRKSACAPRQTYTPDQVADAFTAIRDNLDLIELAYDEAINTPAPAVTFQVWDATAPGYLEAHGLIRLKTPSESQFFPSDKRRPPDFEWMAANAVPKMAEFDPLSIDIECYGKKDNPDDPAPYTPEEIEWLRRTVEVFHEGNPGQRVGVYMTPPERYGGCSAYPDDSPTYNERWASWTERNKIMQPLADEADMMFPSLYGLYSKMDQWERFARQNVEQTRMLAGKKPVIGYLMSDWHNNAEATGPIGYDDFMRMLEVCYDCCDGVAIWRGSKTEFNPEDAYWKATVDFMKRYHLNGY